MQVEAAALDRKRARSSLHARPLRDDRRNLKIQNIPSGGANNSECGTTITRNMQIDNNGTAVQIGATAPQFCDLRINGRSVVRARI
jgi:hypothetical protein